MPRTPVLKLAHCTGSGVKTCLMMFLLFCFGLFFSVIWIHVGLISDGWNLKAYSHHRDRQGDLHFNFHFSYRVVRYLSCACSFHSHSNREKEKNPNPLKKIHHSFSLRKVFRFREKPHECYKKNKLLKPVQIVDGWAWLNMHVGLIALESRWSTCRSIRT